MSEKLSHELLDSGFFCALGTTERCGGQEVIVKAGTPFTAEINNGVLAIYDEQGRPWIATRSMNIPVNLTDLFLGLVIFGLKAGAYVPHSNDGGHFANAVVPPLIKRPPGVVSDFSTQKDALLRLLYHYRLPTQ